MPEPTITDRDYKKRVESQIQQYADKEALIGLPKIYQYWSQKYLAPKVEHVFGTRNIYKMYANAYIGASQDAGGKHAHILSVGCGDGNVEMEIAKALLAQDFTDFTIFATDLSPIRIERAQELALENALEDYFEFKVVDVNDWEPDRKFLGVVAQHTLHHIVELEKVFTFVHDNLEDEGVFVIVDMIGRNGHMRWPETLAIVEDFWKILPDTYKFQHQFKKYFLEFDNFDCSKSGFEGIRAQDILPLLVEHFSFSHFLGVGGLSDVFCERGYGHNFSPDSETDLAYIDIMAKLNDAMLQSGDIKPTMIFAICRRKTVSIKEKCYKGLTAADSIRDPDI